MIIPILAEAAAAAGGITGSFTLGMAGAGAGIGIGMLTFATAEPMYHFAANPSCNSRCKTRPR